MSRDREILYTQLARDYCCTPAEIAQTRPVFTQFEKRAGRRHYLPAADDYLKIACINGKMLVTGEESVVAWCERRYRDTNAAWFMEYQNLAELDARIRRDGFRIGQAHIFYVPDNRMPSSSSINGTLTWYRDEEIKRFRGDVRFCEAFAFCTDAPDRVGVSLTQEDRIVGMAGASEDSPLLWQVGVNVMPDVRGQGIGTLLVSLLSRQLQSQGVLPFYGTAMSHIASQRLALRAGFFPAWTELTTERIPTDRTPAGRGR